jgi:hypothetical protein
MVPSDRWRTDAITAKASIAGIGRDRLGVSALSDGQPPSAPSAKAVFQQALSKICADDAALNPSFSALPSQPGDCRVRSSTHTRALVHRDEPVDVQTGNDMYAGHSSAPKD